MVRHCGDITKLIKSPFQTHVASVKDLYETQIKKLQEDLANSRLHSEDSTSLVNSNISSDEIKDDHSFVCTEPKVEKNFLEEILNGGMLSFVLRRTIVD